MKRHSQYFHRRKSTTRDVKRKAVEDRARVEAFFQGWSSFIASRGIRRDNIWNFDETGFMVGYLQKGTFLWTFNEVERPVLTDSHETVSVTAVEAISAAGNCIPPFLILPGVQIPVRWIDNELDGDTVLTTSPKGYINDMIAIEWIEHFEKHTRPHDPSETRVLLMDSCTNHHTEELVHFCHDHGIELFPLPPHLTHKLQPLDVGVFRSYKHWHQQVLYREIANGATDFSKTDFLYHLQEIRTRTFKKCTILSAWEKCGLFPYNPAVVLDQLQDALSSLTKAVDQRDLPGFIDHGIEQAEGADRGTPKRRPMTETPPTIRRMDWNKVTTPRLSLLTIEQYNEYVKLRIQVSLLSEVPITPSVSHVHEKARKAAHTLALNGVTATAEMKVLKDKQVRRSALLEKASIVGKFGPLSINDARLRAAQDEYNRLAAQREEESRLLKKGARDEAAYIRRWLQRVRANVRASIRTTTARKAHQQGGWLKGDRRALLNCAMWLCQRYALHRELVEMGHCQQSNAIVWPRDYNAETINHAVQLYRERDVDNEVLATSEEASMDYIERRLARTVAGSPFSQGSCGASGARKKDVVNSHHYRSRPIDWWKINRSRYPRLSLMAVDMLTIPSTSAESERTFSSAGRSGIYPSLTHFEFSLSDVSYAAHNQNKLTDAATLQLARICPNLRVVKLQGAQASRLTDDALIGFLSNCSNLTSVEVSGHEAAGTITEASFDALREHPAWAPKLKTLRIPRCEYLARKDEARWMKAMRALSRERDTLLIEVVSVWQVKKWGDWELETSLDKYRRGKV
ncbi:pol-like protein [Purpureocillium lavendulum]|uniref:Pol-like protein n=1 Tax=Purpureocillium lavendulum TaxID=1247861 RepID=A0AB34FCS5_9HYPO|nr:pol-like protein [Purpureocillium lavendulum]